MPPKGTKREGEDQHVGSTGVAVNKKLNLEKKRRAGCVRAADEHSSSRATPTREGRRVAQRIIVPARPYIARQRSAAKRQRHCLCRRLCTYIRSTYTSYINYKVSGIGITAANTFCPLFSEPWVFCSVQTVGLSSFHI